MRVTCPECESKFKVPDTALGTTGRKLRCGKCAHEWFQEPPSLAPAVKEPVLKSGPSARPAREPEPPPVAEEDEDDFGAALRARREEQEYDPPPLGGVSRFRGSRPPERPKRRVPVALLALVAAAVAVPVALLAARAPVVHAWPASALLYETVGMPVPVPGEGLVLQNIYVQRRQEGSVTLLAVAGEIRNPTDRLRSLPALRGTVLDERGETLQSWLFTAEVQQLLPGDVARFTSEFAGPSAEAKRVNVTFTDERPQGGLGY